MIPDARKLKKCAKLQENDKIIPKPEHTAQNDHEVDHFAQVNHEKYIGNMLLGVCIKTLIEQTGIRGQLVELSLELVVGA